MRLIRNTLLLLILLMFLIFVYQALSPKLLNLSSTEKNDLQTILQKEASVKLSYLLDQKKWLSYALQPDDELVRVMSNAILDKNYVVGEEDRFLYSIKYEVVNDASQVIDSGEFYHQAGQKTYEDTITGQHYTSTHIYLAQANPADSRIHLINLRGLKKANQIRFQRGVFNKPVQDIALRAYQKKMISDRKLDYGWQRLGEDKRQQLAKVSVYDASIINEKEQQQLLKNQWAPLGPLGVADEDYTIQKLYVVNEVENDIIINVPAVPSTGLVIYPDRYGMLTLPENNNQLKINWNLFDNSALKASTDQVTIEWWGRPATRYKKFNTLISDTKLITLLDSGVVRISSQQPIVIRAWRKPAKNKSTKNDLNKSHYKEITPKPAYLRLFNSADFDLVYKVNHIRGYKTPMRFDLRAIDEIPTSNIKYRLLDKNDRIIKTGIISLQQSLSAYDNVVSEVERWLTEPQRLYFNLPGRVSKISFNAPAGVWVSAYTRPKNLAYLHIDPMTEKQRNKAVPVWFAKRPEHWKDYMLKGRSKLITVQRRPPQIDQKLLAGMYKWDQFYPDGAWKGRNILTPLVTGKLFREAARTSRYIELKNAESQEINFIAKLGTDTIRPSLIFAKTVNKSLTIKLWVKDKLVFEKEVYANNGELQLPYIESGINTVRAESIIDGKPETTTRLFINNSDINENTSDVNIMLKRLAIAIPEKNLSFTILKERHQELLAMRIFTPIDMNKTLKLHVKVTDLDGRHIGPYRDWTLVNREYDIGKSLWTSFSTNVNNNTAPLILNTKQEVTSERLFFIPLGRDLKNKKRYKIEVNSRQGAGAFMILTRTIPGLYPDRQLYPDIEIESINE